jgi:RNA polymerase sigma-70 factor (ECF subfamily)
MYEEKTSAEIAAQVGLTENATNQLIFRARSAFKKALLGDDVDTTGMSVSKILSVAARKAAFEAKKVGAQAMVFVLFLILGIGAVVNFTSRPNNQIQAGPTQTPSSQLPSPAVPVTQAPIAGGTETAAPNEPSGEVVQNQTPTSLPTTNAAQPVAAAPSQAASPAASTSPFNRNALQSLYAAAPEVAYASKAEVKLTADFRQDYLVSASTGAFAEFSFDADAENPFQEVKFTITVADKQYVVYVSQAETIKAVDKSGNQRFVFFSSMKYFVDSKGKVWDQAEVAKGTVRLEMVVNNSTRQVVGSGLNILPTN